MSENFQECRTYWGSHGCCLARGHDGPCICSCADPEGIGYEEDQGTEGKPPYYGADTKFYGPDAEAAGKPIVCAP